MKICFAIISLFWGAQVFAYTGTIQKVNGNKAIVEFEKGAALHTGDSVSNEGGSSSHSSSSGKHQGRDYSIELYSVSYTSASISGGASTSTLAVSGQMGFSFMNNNLAVGPILQMGSTSGSGTSTSTTTFGAFGNYFLSGNKPNQEWVYGVGGNFTSSSSSPGGSSTTTMTGYGLLRWFPFGNNVAFNAQAFFGQASYTGGNTASIMGVSSGPIIYF